MPGRPAEDEAPSVHVQPSRCLPGLEQKRLGATERSAYYHDVISGQHAPGEQLEVEMGADLQLSRRAIGAADLAEVRVGEIRVWV